jgi:hypothetical protein
MVIDKDGRRVKGDHQGTGDETDRVKKVHHLPGQETGCDGKEENPVAESPERRIVRSLRALPFPEENSIEEIDGRSHGAEPSTEEIAKEEDDQEHAEGRKHSQNEIFLGQEGNDSDEGIEPEIEVDRNDPFEGEGRPNDQIEKEEEGEELNGPLHSKNRFCHVALTFFTRTLERSISPNPNS